MNMVDLAAIIPFILTVILETMDDIVIIGEILTVIPFILTVILETMDDIVIIGEILTVIPVVMSFFILSDMFLGILPS